MKSRRQRVVESCPECGTLADVTAHEPFTKVTCPSCRKPFRARTVFDHFIIKEQIGTGGMSRVFRARDTSLQRDVALKILNKDCSRDTKRARQFEKEAEITAKITHPNVVRVFTARRDQGQFYIAMELVSGGSLESSIRDHSILKEQQVLEMAIHAVQGLKAAHEAGLIHRDIKPGNILYAEDGTPKIVDFGLAIFARDSDGSGEIWATPYYVPLETLNHEPEDFRSDIYSLGATLFHALTGKPPCTRDSCSLPELKEIKTRPIHLKPATVKLSEETCAMLERTLAVKPADRYESYPDFLDHLKYALRRLRRGGKGKPWPGRRRKIHRAWQWAGAAAAVIAAGFGIWMQLREKPPRASTGGGGSLVTDADPTAGSDSSTSGRFLIARDAMLNGDFGKARQLFEELGDAPATRQPTRNWARFNAGLSALLMGDTGGARKIFAAIAAGGLYSTRAEDADLAHFFESTAQRLSAPEPVDPAHMADCPPNSVRAMGLLAAGLKNWHEGEVAGAEKFLRAFDAAAPPPGAAWVISYQPLIREHLLDAAVIALLSLPDVSKLNAAEVDAALTAARDQLKKLTLAGVAKDKAAADVDAFALRASARKAQLAGAGDADRSRRMNEELKSIYDVNAAAAGLAQALRFQEVSTRLRSLSLTTPDATSVRDAHCNAWDKAAAFLEQLTKDLARPLEAAIEPEPGSKPIRAAWTIEGAALKARPAGGPEIRIPLSKVKPERLIELAWDIRERVFDSDEYYRRSELIFSFALRTGLTITAADCGETLASELRSFREQFSLLNTVVFANSPAENK